MGYTHVPGFIPPSSSTEDSENPQKGTNVMARELEIIEYERILRILRDELNHAQKEIESITQSLASEETVDWAKGCWFSKAGIERLKALTQRLQTSQRKAIQETSS